MADWMDVINVRDADGAVFKLHRKVPLLQSQPRGSAPPPPGPRPVFALADGQEVEWTGGRTYVVKATGKVLTEF